MDPLATEFRGGRFPLADLHRASMQAGGGAMLEGRTFTDCVIEGPAVMAVMDGTVFDNCNMGTAANPRNLLVKPLGDKMAGVVGMSRCRFVRCRFVQIAFTGSDALLAELEQGIGAGNDAMAKAGEAQ